MPGYQPQSETDAVSPEHEYDPCKREGHDFQYFCIVIAKAFCKKCGKVINLDGHSS